MSAAADAFARFAENMGNKMYVYFLRHEYLINVHILVNEEKKKIIFFLSKKIKHIIL